MRIVFTGAPCSGKTTMLNHFGTVLPVVPEVAREWLSFFKEHDPLLMPQSNHEFFQTFLETMALKNHVINTKAIFDRSLVDEIAYRNYFNISRSETLIDKCSKYRYDLVFYFPFWNKIYENDLIRTETSQQAKTIGHYIWSAYYEMNYKPIIVPLTTLDERKEFIKNEILKVWKTF